MNDNNQYKICDDELRIVQDYFVEIFSWSVIPKKLLFIINEILEDFISDYTLIDPCSGNSFHTFLFNEFCNKKVQTIDIQIEKDPWIETIECDGLEFIKNIDEFSDKVLILSWIDYDNLTTNLIKSFKGMFVLSIGYYNEQNSKQYLTQLKNNYNLINHFVLNMPWGLQENIKIYFRKD